MSERDRESIPTAAAATIRGLRAVARRLDSAHEWQQLAAALRVNRRIWAKVQLDAATSSIAILPHSVATGMALAAAGADRGRLDDYTIQMIADFNRRTAAALLSASRPGTAA